MPAAARPSRPITTSPITPFQLDFDPTLLSYDQLLREIWANRRGGRSHSRQYMEAVFPTAAQAAIANGSGITAPLVLDARFRRGLLRHDSTLMRELADYSPAQQRESTLAARLDGYVAGKGSQARLEEGRFSTVVGTADPRSPVAPWLIHLLDKLGQPPSLQ